MAQTNTEFFYNARWSCPLTPFENHLKVPIRAGEKIPSGDWVGHEGLENPDEM